jgi:small-conductance mechanosensitive channel
VQQQGLGDLLNTAGNATSGTASAAPVSTHGVHIFGVTLIGLTAHNGHKLVLTIGFIAIAWLVAWVLRKLLGLLVGTRGGTMVQFWAKQGVSLVIAAIVILGLASIWFDSPAQLAAVVGLIGAGIAFAMQQVVTAVAGYFVILRGKTFNVGDRIQMGGVRGDVIGLSFMQTRIMEMGESPREQGDAPSMWVRSRQFTGRIVTVTNDKVFDCPVYNYTHDFPYIWDEICVPLHFHQDFEKAERILLDSGRKFAVTDDSLGKDEVQRLKEKFGIEVGQIDPRVFWRMTENWLELTVRFLAPDHGIRSIKDQMTREIVQGLEKAGIVIAAVRQEAVSAPEPKRRAVRAKF